LPSGVAMTRLNVPMQVCAKADSEAERIFVSCLFLDLGFLGSFSVIEWVLASLISKDTEYCAVRSGAKRIEWVSLVKR